MLGGGLPAPKNIICDPATGTITPEWLSWLQDLADTSARINATPTPPNTPAPAVPGPIGGGGTGAITVFNNYGSGTPGYHTKWLAPQQLGDSLISEAGGVVTSLGPIVAPSFAGSLPINYLTGFPGNTTEFLRADGT